MRTDGLPYEACEGTLEWTMKRVEGHVTSLRGRWAPMADLVADILRPMTREQRSRCVERMGHTEDMPTTMRLRVWAGAAVRENVPAQDVDGDGSDFEGETPDERKARLLRGCREFRRGLAEGYAAMGKAIPAEWVRVCDRMDERGAPAIPLAGVKVDVPDHETLMHGDCYDPFGDEVAA